MKKAALPYPNTPSSIKAYYGLKSRVVKCLILKEFMIPASPTKAGWVSRTLNTLSEAMKSNIRGVIPSRDYLYEIQSNFT